MGRSFLTHERFEPIERDQLESTQLEPGPLLVLEPKKPCIAQMTEKPLQHMASVKNERGQFGLSRVFLKP